MDYKEYTAKTVDEAITLACMELGVTSDRLEYDVTQESSNGFLGIGAKPAVIRARARSAEEIQKEQKAIDEMEKAEKESVVTKALSDSAPHENEKPASKEKKIITSDEIEKRAAAAAAKAKTEWQEEKTERREYRREGRNEGRGGKNRGKRHERDKSFENTSAPAAQRPEPSKPKPERVVKERTGEEAEALLCAAREFLTSVFAAMEIDAEIKTEYNYKEGSVNCTFAGDDMGILIGKRGQTLDSLQYLTSLVVNKTTDDYVRVKLDTEDYRARRADTLSNLARNIAYKVKKTHRPVALEPMNPYERRIIHSSLQSNKFVETYSEGEEPFRHVVVAPKR